MIYPFNHECEWGGPFYFWASNETQPKVPDGCKPVEVCQICGAQRPAPTGDKQP